MALPAFSALAPGVGPPAAVFDYHPSVSLIEEYTDNFDRAAVRKRSNLRSALSTGLSLNINGAFTKGLISTSLAVAHDTVSGGVQDNVFPSLLGQVTWEATPRLSLTVTDVLTRSDEPSRADRLSLRRERGTFTSNVFSLESGYRIDTISTREYYRVSTFFDQASDDTISHVFGANATSRIFDSTTSGTAGYEYISSATEGATTSGHSLTGSLSRQLNITTSVGVSGGYSIRSTRGGRTPGDNFQTLSVGVFNSYAIPGRWSLSGNIGVSRLTSDSGADATSISTASALSYSFARATLSLSVDRGFSETFVLGENFGVVETQGVTASLTYPFTPFVTGSASTFYRENKQTSVGTGRTDFNAESLGASLTLSVRLLRWLSLGLDYFYTQDTTGTGDTITENRARATLTAGF